MVRKPQIKLLTKYLIVSDSDHNSKSLMLDNSTNTNQIALCFATKEIITGKTPYFISVLVVCGSQVNTTICP